MNKLFKNKFQDLPRNFKHGIKNLKKWFPIIWKDRNWDHHYIYIILRHKLHLTEQLIRNKGRNINAEKNADKIKLCINLLDRLIKDEYHTMAFRKIDETWGELEMSSTPCKDDPNLSNINLTRSNIKTEKDIIKERKEFKVACQHEQYSKEQDLEYLFKMMIKHIQRWWD